jgi:DNA-binding NarL/FixJ family response regulator
MDICEPDGDVRRKKVLIVDDHFIVRRGLTQLLEQQANVRVCATAASAEEALELAAQESFDLAIVDISMGQMDGLELTQELKNRHPNIIVLVLSMYDESLYGERARQAGAAGFVAKQDGGDALLEAISHVLSGQLHYSADA